MENPEVPFALAITPAARQVGCTVVNAFFQLAAGVNLFSQRVLPQLNCGFITESVTHTAGFPFVVGLVGIEPTTSTMST